MLPEPPPAGAPLTWVSVGPLADFPLDHPHAVTLDLADGRRIPLAVVRRAERTYIVGGLCPHRGAPLGELGFLDDEGNLVCGWHYWAFRLEDGGQTLLPGVTLGCWPSQVVEGELLIGVRQL